MVRELPLLLGAIGTVIGFFTLPGIVFLFAISYPPTPSSWFALAWAVGPFLGLAGDIEVKKHGKLGGLLFLTAGTLPWLSGFLASGIIVFGTMIFIFWTPLIFAGVLAVLNWPGPFVDKEDFDDQEVTTPSPG